MQRGVVKSISSSGEVTMAVLLSDPLPLSLGKKAVNLFVAGCAWLPMLRKVCPAGICITHVAFDRAALSALDRLFRQRRAAYYQEGVGPDLGYEAQLLSLTDWLLNTPCSLHGCQQGLK